MDAKKGLFNVELSELSQAPFEKIRQSNSQHGSGPETESSQPQEWFSDPKELQADSKAELLTAAYDGFLIAIPIILIVKTILCIVASRLDRWHQNVEIGAVTHLTIFLVNFNGQLSTAFTIAFVTIMSTMVRRWALYKAQRGAYLSEIEQLQASISLPSTAKMIWSLRRFGPTSAGLLFLWCFYYMGSQACRLEYSLVDSRPYHKVRLAMMKPTILSPLAQPALSPNQLSSQAEVMQSAANELISSSDFSESTSNQPRPFDQIGRPLVPVIESISTKGLDEMDKILNRASWADVTTADEQIFASYLGPDLYQNYSLTEFGIGWDFGNNTYDDTHQFLGNINFTSQYMLVNCTIPEPHPITAFPNGTLAGSEISINFTNTDRALNAAGQPTLPLQFELWGRWNTTSTDGIPLPAGFVMNGSIVSVCNLTRSVVDVQANCLPNGCSVKKVRYNKSYPGPSPITPFDDDAFAKRFFDNLLISMGPPIESDPGDFTWSTGVARLVDLSDVMSSFSSPPVDGDNISDDLANNMPNSANALSQVINTYYLATQSFFGDCTVDINNHHNPNCTEWTGWGAVYNTQYHLSVPWIVVDFISCSVLLGAAVFAHWLRTRTIAPDILGYVSSFTRENPHFNLPTENGSVLSGLERARLLGNVKIKIGEFKEQGLPRVVVSHVAAGFEAGALHKEGKYA